MNIPILKPSFVWDTRNSIIQVTTFAIPLAIEAIHLAIKIYKNPDCLKDGLLKVKVDIVEAFTKNSVESDQEYKQRLMKNIARVALGALLIVGSGCVAYFLAPSAYSISAAIIAIQVFGVIWSGLDQIPQKFNDITAYLQDAFHQRNWETIDLFHQRRLKAIKNIVGCALLFVASIPVIVGAVKIGILLSHANSIWRLYDELPFQTPLGVFIEYAVVGVAHAALAAYSWSKGNKEAALFHSISAVAAVAFPIFYILEGKKVRLHHSFIGLVFQLLPWRPLQVLGSAMTLDSFIDSYLKGVPRGHRQGSYTHQYDYQNALLDHLPFATLALSSLCLLSRTVDYLIKKQPKPQNLLLV